MEIKGGEVGYSSSLGNKGDQSKYPPIEPKGGGGRGWIEGLLAKFYKPSDSNTGRSNSVSETINSESDKLKDDFKEYINTVDLSGTNKKKLILYFDAAHLDYVDNTGKLIKSGTDSSFANKLDCEVDL